MDERKAVLLNEMRYAERLTQRTARLYRRVAWGCTFLGVIGGSGLASALAAQIPAWVSIVGGALLVLAGAVMLTVRPMEKAILNEQDARKYAALRTASVSMDADALSAALDKARESDAAEIEPLRDVAYNDLMLEIGREDLRVPLKKHQAVLSALA